MFPRVLAEGCFSLRMGLPCPALSVGVVLDSQGAVQSKCVRASTITPTRRLSYIEADAMLASGTADQALVLLSQVLPKSFVIK